MISFEKNGIREGVSVVCADVPRLIGRVTHCSPWLVKVKWEDGRIGQFEWDEDVACNAYRLQVVVKRQARISYSEFIGKLKATPRRWRVYYSRLTDQSAIRTTDGHCPITAVCVDSGVATEYRNAAEVLGLDDIIAGVIVRAADGGGDPSVRADLLKACGVRERDRLKARS